MSEHGLKGDREKEEEEGDKRDGRRGEDKGEREQEQKVGWKNIRM